MEEQAQAMQQAHPAFMSADISALSAALSEFQGKIKQPQMSKEVTVQTKGGSKYKFQYADLSACMAAAAPVLMETGLSVAQIIIGRRLITLLAHKSGQWMKSEMDINISPSSTYQDLGSAITYLKRYSYCAILGIVADDDDDANAACGNKAVMTDLKPQAVRQAQPQQPSPQPDGDPNWDIIRDDISRATDKDSLNAVFRNWQGYQQDKQFIAMLSARKKELGI